MSVDRGERAVAIVGLGAILPDAPNSPAFWQNIISKRYSISDVTPDRWRLEDYYDPDPSALDKTYSKIGGWVRGFTFDWKKFTTPPRVAGAMDEGQQWAVSIAAEAMADYGYPQRPLDLERTGVIVGTAMGGELHYFTSARVMFPEFAKALSGVGQFGELPADVRQAILSRWHEGVNHALPTITEDSMPGELPNIVAGRIANVLNLRGPNFITDAACASSFAALAAAVDLLVKGQCEAVLTGGVDRNMGPSTFVKFCKIGALSATGTRPFGDGADGFVMGEGSAAFLLKRLTDAERDGDRIYAVVRGVGGSSDGRGKGITAPNPVGQKLAVQRAWDDAGLDPATATLVEAHGTSTKVGDVVEVSSLSEMFRGAGTGRIALGSAKSNIGHLKAGAGAAGLLKAVYALHYKTIPPTLNAERPNPVIDFGATPFYLATEAREWERLNGTPRRSGVSAYGFGGTNFHVVLEEHVPGALTGQGRSTIAVGSAPVPGPGPSGPVATGVVRRDLRVPLRGIVAIGAQTGAELEEKLGAFVARVKDGYLPPVGPPAPADLSAPERLVVDFGTRDELVDRLQKAERALGFDTLQAWKALSAQGVFRGSGPRRGRVAFLFPGQGSQYVNMGKELAAREPAVAQVFSEADEAMQRIVGHRLTEYIFVDEHDAAAVARCEEQLMQTAITQPAVLTMDDALRRLLGEFNVTPDCVMGHSLGEYAALVTAGVLPFAHALEAAAARGREMTRVSFGDNGWMAAVMAPLAAIEETLAAVGGYVVAANINSGSQAVIGGETEAVRRAIEAFTEKGFQAVRLPVSHAFHTRIVAPASQPLRQVLDRLTVTSPRLPLVANVTGELYPTTPEAIKDLLEQQIAAPVQWVKGLQTLYREGVRTFVEVGPKKALKGFVDDVLGNQPDVVSLFTNHPKPGGLQTFNHAICGLYAAGHGLPVDAPIVVSSTSRHDAPAQATAAARGEAAAVAPPDIRIAVPAPAAPVAEAGGHDVSAPVPPSPSLEALAQIFGSMMQSFGQAGPGPRMYDRNDSPNGSVVISGTGLGLPGSEKPVMDPANVERILRGEQFIDLVPERFRVQMARKHVTRIVKSADGSGSFQTIDDTADVIKLAGRPGTFDLTAEFGVAEKLVEALDTTTQLAIAAGIDALREAGIPLVQTWRKTTTGKFLPDRWMLPEALRDETGVIFASAFPGMDRFADETQRYFTYESRLAQREALEGLRQVTRDPDTLREIHRRLTELDEVLAREPYQFDRRFMLRVLPMGHSQFAEYIGARGPNAIANAACAATAQAISIAEDWIRTGRCRRVVVVGADNVTSEHLLGWVGAGFLATGAAATDDKVSEAAVPFDRRRHGTILGMGACALVVESQDAVEERGMRGIVELLSTETRNSAFHATRLDVDHVAMTMESLVASAERRFGINRYHVAPEAVFMSHETFTPARGGSASAEVAALRRVFGQAASEIVMANTKGFTGHPMGVGVEDVIAVKILEHAIVPPVPNFKEVDPDLGPLTLSRGGRYPVKYAIHLAAGFGSQVAMTLTRRIPGSLDRVDNPALYQKWLDDGSGYDRAETEVAKRTLRVRSKGAPARPAAPSHWTWGTGPTRRAPAPGDGAIARSRSVPLPAASAAIRLALAASAAAPVSAPAERVPSPVPAATPAAALAPPPAAPAVQQAVATAASAAAPAARSGEQEVQERVLAIVAEKTGYPPDMLDMDLDLEADLGVDTVKQAETFAAVRAAYDIPRQDTLKLRDFPTMKHVVQFVLTNRPDLAARAGAGAAPITTAAAAPAAVAPPTSGMAPLPASLPVSGVDGVRARVIEIVAEKTGYPPDMLDMDLDLEADLGVDTVKQAETFAAVRAAYDIPRQETLKLRDFPTMKHVVQFVLTNRPDLAAAGVGAATMDRSATPASPSETTARTGVPVAVATLADADRMPRRVVVPSLRPPLEFCKATSVSLAPGARVVVVHDERGAGARLVELLASRNVAALEVPASASADALEPQIRAWLDEGPVTGVYWLPALDVEPDLSSIDLDLFRALNRRRTKALYATMRVLYGAIEAPGTFLVSATSLGGVFGQDEAGATAPLGGGVLGFTKAYKRERPDALVKVVDFAEGADAADIAGGLLAETLSDPGIVEVGYRNGHRSTLTLEERSAADGQPGLGLGPDSVFLVTGAAGGITSAIVADLAASSGGTFYLLDLVEPPEPGDPHVLALRADREGLKRTLIEEARARGERPTPVAIDTHILGIERREAALSAIESVAGAGGTAHYRSVNLLDGPAVTAVVEEIRERHGRVDVLVHAGGIEISRALADKEPHEFDLVFDIKADGFFSLLRATEGMPLGATVVFSSVAGRFGNSGQTDYSASNALLCCMSRALGRLRPDTRAIAIDWTAWGGIGMAMRGSIPRIMELAGIEMLPPEAGIPTVRREIVAGGTADEIVVGGRLGILAAEWDETGGLDTAKVAAWLASRARPLAMIGEVKGAFLHGGLRVDTTLDPGEQAFLHDHQIDGTPVLPGVMGTEAFAQLASVLCPGHEVGAVEQAEFLLPFKFFRRQPATLQLVAYGRALGDGDVRVGVRLESIVQPKPDLPPQERVHFRAQVRMTRHAGDQPTLDFVPPEATSFSVGRDAIYRIYFHGPAYQVLDGVHLDNGRAVGLMAQDLPPNGCPAHAASLTTPRLVELCFQAAGILEIARDRQLGLPTSYQSVRSFRPPEAANGDRLFALVTRHDGATPAYDAQVVDGRGRVFVDLRGYRTIALPGEVSLDEAKAASGT